MGIENPVHLLFIAAVALVFLGPRRLPELARSLGKGIREFRESLSDGSVTGAPHVPAPQSPPAAPEDATVLAPRHIPAEPVHANMAPSSQPSAASQVDPPEPSVASQADPPGSAAASQVDPPEPVRSGDHAPDSRSL